MWVRGYMKYERFGTWTSTFQPGCHQLNPKGNGEGRHPPVILNHVRHPKWKVQVGIRLCIYFIATWRESGIPSTKQDGGFRPFFSPHMMGIARTNQDFSGEIGNVFNLVPQNMSRIPPGGLCRASLCAAGLCASDHLGSRGTKGTCKVGSVMSYKLGGP